MLTAVLDTMTALQCGDFVLVGTDVNTKLPRWRAQLTPSPLTREQQDALSAAHLEVRDLGVLLGEGGIEIHYTGGFMFHAAAGAAPKIAHAMHDIVRRANIRLAERQSRNVEYARVRMATAGTDSGAAMSLWVDHLATSPPATLYHYTTQRGLIGIATAKSLWSTPVHRLADSTEFLGAKDLCRALLTQSLSADPELAEHLRRTIDSIVTEIYIFVCCFSEEGDLLSQWRAYCPQGGGVSLGFDPIELRDIASGQGFTLVKCIYDESRAIALLNAIIQDAVVSRQAGTPLEKISQSFLGWFFQIAPAIKNRSFWEEREWRLLPSPLFSLHLSMTP